MPKIDRSALRWNKGSGCPQIFQQICEGRERKRLGDAADLTQFGVNIARLVPGAASALRHWHESEDEFVFILDGEVTLVEDDGETILVTGDAAGFKAGVANGHHLVNKSASPAVYLEVGTRAAAERAHYPDDDLYAEKDADGFRFLHKDKTPYA